MIPSGHPPSVHPPSVHPPSLLHHNSSLSPSSHKQGQGGPPHCPPPKLLPHTSNQGGSGSQLGFPELNVNFIKYDRVTMLRNRISQQKQSGEETSGDSEQNVLTNVLTNVPFPDGDKRLCQPMPFTDASGHMWGRRGEGGHQKGGKGGKDRGLIFFFFFQL